MAGICIGNLSWRLDGRTLIISGTGAADDIQKFSDEIVKAVVKAGAPLVEDFTFSFFSRLESVEIFDGIKKIGNSAFLFCESLTEIDLPASVVKLGNSAFCGCWSLTEINLPANLIELGDNVFANCSNLRGIELPDGLKKIGNGAFKGCENLTEIKIPASVVKIGGEIFAGCEALEKIFYASGSKFAKILRGGNNAELITFDAPPKENFSWSIDGDTLKISGEEAVKKIFCDENAPWYDRRELIKKIFIAS